MACAFVIALSSCVTQPHLPPMPEVAAPRPQDSVPLGNARSFPEAKLDLDIASGPFAPSWESIETNYPGVPDWLREAKFGIWVHFGPQASGQSGDWYARNLYKQGHAAYQNHLKNFGHPSEVGYKEVLRAWNPTNLNPAALSQSYKEAGARFLIIQGVHHDNFDLWDSRHHPWNSTRLGPKRNLLAEWAKAARSEGMRYGVTFHHEYTWYWWQTAFGSDKDGPKAGVPYDAHLTLADGKGKWWEGLDPRLLYGIDLREYEGVARAAAGPWNVPASGIFTNHLRYAEWYATQWALRMMDVIDGYDPDFIYTDGTSTQPFSGSGTGSGYKCDAMQRVIAHFYNQALARRGKVDTFSIVKFRPKNNGTVNTEEHGIPAQIKTDQPWIAEAPVGDWYYSPGFTYDSGMVIRYVIEAVAKDGNAAVCVSLLPDGSLDEGSQRMLKEVGVWMRRNGEAIYGSRAWRVAGEGNTDGGRLKMLPGGKLGRRHAEFQFGPTDFRFTLGKDGAVYAFCMAVPEPGARLNIKTLGSNASQRVRSVKMLGHDGPLDWRQESDGLTVTCPPQMPFATSVVFRIEL
ncbi:MAG TPA: alpha-L-fucosidase [Verrucomicrobiae bacterium]|nr:alpha-L-fucosidase [Verrucomicrobiae bacterium]